MGAAMAASSEGACAFSTPAARGAHRLFEGADVAAAGEATDRFAQAVRLALEFGDGGRAGFASLRLGRAAREFALALADLADGVANLGDGGTAAPADRTRRRDLLADLVHAPLDLGEAQRHLGGRGRGGFGGRAPAGAARRGAGFREAPGDALVKGVEAPHHLGQRGFEAGARGGRLGPRSRHRRGGLGARLRTRRLAGRFGAGDGYGGLVRTGRLACGGLMWGGFGFDDGGDPSLHRHARAPGHVARGFEHVGIETIEAERGVACHRQT